MSSDQYIYIFWCFNFKFRLELQVWIITDNQTAVNLLFHQQKLMQKVVIIKCCIAKQTVYNPLHMYVKCYIQAYCIAYKYDTYLLIGFFLLSFVPGNKFILPLIQLDKLIFYTHTCLSKEDTNLLQIAVTNLTVLESLFIMHISVRKVLYTQAAVGKLEIIGT